MTDPCYPLISPAVARPAGIARRIFRRVAARPAEPSQHGGHAHSVHPGPVRGHGAHQGPAYGPPAPPVAEECARVPGALPAGPGRAVPAGAKPVAGAKAIGAGATGAAGVATAGGLGGVAAGGLGGAAKAALVAGGLGLAGVGGVAALRDAAPTAGTSGPAPVTVPLAIALPGIGDVNIPPPGSDGPQRAFPSPNTAAPGAPIAIPEPMSLVLLAAGVVMTALAARGRWRR